MQNPQWNNRTPDELTGSPELFATNLLLVRAIENSIDSIEIKKEPDAVTVQLISSETDYDRETLTEKMNIWSKIKDRFKSITEFESDSSKKGTLEPNIPIDEQELESMKITYHDESIVIDLNY